MKILIFSVSFSFFYLLHLFFILYYIISKASKEIRIVKLCGGLGNQMFQYAYGKSLEHKLQEKVLFDVSWYKYLNKKKNEKLTKREYGLGIFNLKISFPTKKQLKKCNNKTFEKKSYIYDEELLQNKGSSYYVGYFQNEKYFKDIKDNIKKIYTFPKIHDTDKFNQQWINKIKNVKNSVFIHIRRADYIYLDGWVLSMDYYKKAIEYIKKNVENPTFFIFCYQCKDYVEEQFKLDDTIQFIGETNSINNENWKDMVLMKECKYAVIANSSFSWWAAWLGRANEEGIVIAPSPFIKNNDEIICDNWIKINSNNSS